MADQTPNKMPRMPRGPKGRIPFTGGSFSNNLMTAFLIFLTIVFVYSLFAGNPPNATEIPISLVANDVGKGLISEISVNGDILQIKYVDGANKTSRTESGISLTEIFKLQVKGLLCQRPQFRI